MRGGRPIFIFILNRGIKMLVLENGISKVNNLKKA